MLDALGLEIGLFKMCIGTICWRLLPAFRACTWNSETCMKQPTAACPNRINQSIKAAMVMSHAAEETL
eukprot:5485659-Amphidinium_carterae.1